ncbi:MAG: hypothetical protein H0A75_01815 [Candidatus Methanofishera endochildressiae]|uniref:Uncharacterized protein n=1 Tax=Candidatus Methanofishera endochildressiae TaxID=2738884 RepID=A0A7Z0SCH9_9GAMM|nr:hypothetical protein [Candidatus Methanofishera endochildressiae]
MRNTGKLIHRPCQDVVVVFLKILAGLVMPTVLDSQAPKARHHKITMSSSSSHSSKNRCQDDYIKLSIAA